MIRSLINLKDKVTEIKRDWEWISHPLIHKPKGYIARARGFIQVPHVSGRGPHSFCCFPSHVSRELDQNQNSWEIERALRGASFITGSGWSCFPTVPAANVQSQRLKTVPKVLLCYAWPASCTDTHCTAPSQTFSLLNAHLEILIACDIQLPNKKHHPTSKWQLSKY